MFDLLIRGGTVIDGTGAPRRVADIAVVGDTIVEVGPRIDGEAVEVVDAEGLLVTPGFVDVHTHYDAQATWDDELLPSAAHGVTTIVMGNCGVGFAPVRPEYHDGLISLMEGVEDIPGTALHEGIRWSWESFPEYLEALDRRSYTMDVAALVPHGALRPYVMGDRGAQDLPASDDDLRAMARVVQEAIEAGAVGFSTSRINGHTSADGAPVPGTTAEAAELLAIGQAMAKAGAGTMEVVPSDSLGAVPHVPPDRWSTTEEYALIGRFARETGQTVTSSFAPNNLGAAIFPEMMDAWKLLYDEGLPVHPQFPCRPIGLLAALSAYHPFRARPSYLALAHLPLGERAERMRDPVVKAAILAESDVAPTSRAFMDSFHLVFLRLAATMYALGNPPDYEPDPSTSIASRAQREGRDPQDVVYDLLLEDDGRANLTAFATSYPDGDLRLTDQLLREPGTVVGLSDAGAHVRAICDASSPTTLLTHWARDRTRGPRLAVEDLVKKQTHDTAALFGFHDRGVVAPGFRADLNVIDWGRLRLGRPYMVADLPGGGERFVQDAEGYTLTTVAGVATRRGGGDTGARPGHLARSGRSARPVSRTTR